MTRSQERKAAQAAYNRALAAVRTAEGGTDLPAWEAATAALNTARAELIRCEAAHPTAGERVRASRRRWMRNIGLDEGGIL